MKHASAPHQWLNRLESINEWTGITVAWLTVVTVCAAFIVVIFQKLPFINYDTTWIYEMANYAHAFVFMLGIAYTFKHDSHVRVDIFYRKASSKTQARIDLFGSLLLLIPLCIFIFLNSWEYVWKSWAIHEGSHHSSEGLPFMYVLKTTMLLMPLLLFIQGVATVLRSALVLRNEPIELHPDHDTKDL